MVEIAKEFIHILVNKMPKNFKTVIKTERIAPNIHL